MSSTKQGSFDTFYHHIDAPTLQDEEYWKQNKKYKLIVPDLEKFDASIYRSNVVAYLSTSSWHYTRKLDGENIRIQWDGEQALWNGKSNAFQCNSDFAEYMNNTFVEEIFEEKYGRESKVILFGEKMGPKTQGNELGLEAQEVILYDVNINGYWMPKSEVVKAAQYFHVRCVVDLDIDHTVDSSVSLNELIVKCAEGGFKDWEGIVATPFVEMQDQDNKRIIVKIKNKDYLR